MAKRTLNNHEGFRVNCIDNSRPKNKQIQITMVELIYRILVLELGMIKSNLKMISQELDK